MTETMGIKNVELGEDLKGFLKANYEDIIITDVLKEEILNFNDEDLILVEKKINSPTEIIDAKIVDDKLIKEYL